MRTNRILLMLFVAAMWSCDDFFEDDLSEESIEVISPLDNLMTTKTTLTFWWNPVNDATHYRLLIVSPNFDTILSNPLDTNLTSTKFIMSLNPGRYNWSVRALNSSSETQPYVQNLTILDDPDLADQEVVLIAPSDNAASGNELVNFQWHKLPNAMYYRLVIKRDTWEGDLAIPEQETSLTSLSVELEEGKYMWGVQGVNEESQSKMLSRTLFVDLTPPAKPVLKSPALNDVVTDMPVDLEWEHSAPDLTTVYDSLFIASDQDFTAESIIQSEKVLTTTYSFSTEYKGKVYWRVKSIDKAGNISEFSDIFNFTIE
jgi:hypothetical protein